LISTRPNEAKRPDPVAAALGALPEQPPGAAPSLTFYKWMTLMRSFFVTFKPPQGDLIRSKFSAPDAAAALSLVDWPRVQVFGLMQYMTFVEVEQALANNPAGRLLLSFEDWEAKYGDATSPEFLWVQPSQINPHTEFHPALNGARVRLCAQTGHARFVSISEHYGSWTAPKTQAAA
jgi:hypothetical protein